MSAAASITVRVPMAIRRRPGRKTVVTPEQDGREPALPTRADPALVKALARAFWYQRLLDERRYASISEMATAEALDRGDTGQLLRLALRAPILLQALVDGGHPDWIILPALMERVSAKWAR
jgi:hypothetical protein